MLCVDLTNVDKAVPSWMAKITYFMRWYIFFSLNAFSLVFRFNKSLAKRSQKIMATRFNMKAYSISETLEFSVVSSFHVELQTS